jgi:hypothetical protein
MIALFARMSGLACLVALLAIGCGKLGFVNPQQASGEYVYGYKDGEIEVLILRNDLTYLQEFYTNTATYRNRGLPAYTNSSAWTHTNKEVFLKNWLMFCDWPNVAQLRAAPRPSSLLKGTWMPPNRKTEAVIWFTEDPPPYVLLRVKNRSEVK